MSTDNPRFPLFDSLRAIAALSVFAVHLPFVATTAADHPLKPFLVHLNIGVAIFFLISGFLLYRPFARARLTGTPRPALGPYAHRRALRIVPAYWVALVFVVVLVGSSGESPSATPVFSPRGVLAYFGFAQVYDADTLLGGVSAAWSLCVEASFYAFLPLWAFLLARLALARRSSFLRSELLALVVLFVIGVLWTTVAAARANLSPAAIVDPTLLRPSLYVLPGYLDHFALGMALAVLSVAVAERSERPGWVQLIERAPWLPWLGAAAAYVALAELPDALPEIYSLRYVAIHVLQGVVAVGLLAPAVFATPGRGLVPRLLGSRPLLWVGLVSYAVYLWHVAVMVQLTRLGAYDALGPVGFTAAALGLTLAIAAVSFYLVERPALRLGRRLSRSSRSQDADMRMRDLAHHEQPGPDAPKVTA